MLDRKPWPFYLWGSTKSLHPKALQPSGCNANVPPHPTPRFPPMQKGTSEAAPRPAHGLGDFPQKWGPKKILREIQNHAKYLVATHTHTPNTHTSMGLVANLSRVAYIYIYISYQIHVNFENLVSGLGLRALSQSHRRQVGLGALLWPSRRVAC